MGPPQAEVHYHRYANPVRIASSLCADMIFGKDTCDWLFLFLRVRNLFLHLSVGIAGPTPGGSPDVVLYPDVDPFIADRLRGVLRY